MRSSQWRPLAAVLAVLVVGTGAALLLRTQPPSDQPQAARPAASPRPNVLFILLDTLRADLVGRAPGPDARMPFLSSLAGRATYYPRAYAASSWTLPSIASIFTAQYPSEHGVGQEWFQSRLSDSTDTLAGVLAAHGYATVAFSAHDGVNSRCCGRGFDRFELAGPPQALLRDARDVNAAALTWLATAPPSPWFLYLHYLDVHHYREHPALTAPPGDDAIRDDQTIRTKIGAGALAASDAARRETWDFTPTEVDRLRALYEGEARYVDEQLRALFAELERRGALAHTIVVITADHGEEFGGRGVFGHGTSLYGPVLHVPLLIALPGEAGEQIDEPTQIAGLAPTLLRELAIPAPAGFRIPPFRLRGPAPPPEDRRYVYAELPANSRLKVRLHDHAITGPQRKIVVTPSGERAYFDLVADDRELRPLASLAGADRLEAAMTQMRPARTAPLGVPTLSLDAATMERLRHLGYAQ